MNTKTCPACGAEVPESASRCKTCFHDFTVTVPLMKRIGPVFLLASLAGMSLVAVIALVVVLQQPLEQRIFVDEATRQIVTITKYRTGDPQTERVMWDDIEKIAYIERMGEFEVAAITKDGESHTIERAEQPLSGAANRYAELLDKPLEEQSELNPGKSKE